MTALLASLLSNPTLIAILTGIVFTIGALFKGRIDGAAKERAKRLKADSEALKDRLEMNREATDIERKTVGMSDEEARKEALRWAKR